MFMAYPTIPAVRGLTGLVRQTREDRGRRKLPAEAVKLIEGLFLKKPRPFVAAVYRRVLTLCKEQGCLRLLTAPSTLSSLGSIQP